MPGRRPCEGAPERIPCPSQWRRPTDRCAAPPHASGRGQPDGRRAEEVSAPRLRSRPQRDRAIGLLRVVGLSQADGA